MPLNLLSQCVYSLEYSLPILCYQGLGIVFTFHGPVQAGAKHVYAVEASAMAEYARKLVAGNHPLSQRITVRYLNFDSQENIFWYLN